MALENLKINNSLFIPTLQLDATQNGSNQPSQNIYEGVNVVKVTNKSTTVALGQNLPFGGSASVYLFNRRRDTNALNTQWDPTFVSALGVDVTQPLLRGVGSLATKYQIYVSSNNFRISKYQLQARIAQLVYDVESAYWELVFAHQNMEAVKMSLQRAMDWLKQNELKVKVGTAAPIEILSSKAQVASNESQLIRAEQTIQTREEALKRILNMSQDSAIILPVDQPEVKTMDVDFNAFLQEAMQNRLDLKQAKLSVENNQLQVKFAKNQALPNLQLTASYSTAGTAGTLWDYPVRNATPIEVTTLKDAWKNAFLFENTDYSVALRLQIPLWMSREKAQISQAKINRESSMLQLKNVENTIFSEVKDIVKQHQTSLKLVEAEKIALQLEEENLKAEEKRLSVGLSTNFNVLEYQRRVASAQSNMIRAFIDYTLTQSRINRILNRTFQVYGINFSEYYDK